MINIIRMLTRDEGMRNKVYKDSVGKYTVGIGFNMDNPTAKSIWESVGIPEDFNTVYFGKELLSQESAWALLSYIVSRCEQDLKDHFSNYDSFPEGVKLALINLMYNMGDPVFSQFKKFIGMIKLKDFEGAAVDLGYTKWASQVGTRKLRVQALLRGDDSLYAQA